MKVIQKKVKLNNEDYFKTHLRIVNTLLDNKISETELEVLAVFLSLDKELTKVDMFNTYARKIAKEKLGNMSPASLSNHLRQLIIKDFLVKDKITGIISVVPHYIPEDSVQGYQIGLIKIKE